MATSTNSSSQPSKPGSENLKRANSFRSNLPPRSHQAPKGPRRNDLPYIDAIHKFLCATQQMSSNDLDQITSRMYFCTVPLPSTNKLTTDQTQNIAQAIYTKIRKSFGFIDQKGSRIAMMYGSDINGTRSHTTEWFDHEGHHLHFIILLPDIFTFRAVTNTASIISTMRSQIMTIRELQNTDGKQLHYKQIQIIPYQRVPGINCVNVFSYTVKAEVNSNHNKLGEFVAGTFPYDNKVSKTQHGSRIDYDDPEIRRRAINLYLFPEKYFPNDKHSAIPPWVKAYRYRHKATKTSRERLKIENEFIRHVRSTTGDASVFRAKPIPISDAKPLPAFRPNF